jgi:hypothetical protein
MSGRDPSSTISDSRVPVGVVGAPFVDCRFDTAMMTIGPYSHEAALTFDGIFFVTAVGLFLRWRGWHPDPVSAGARPSVT